MIPPYGPLADGILFVVLVVLIVPGVVAARRVRLPFEYLWPVGAILALAIAQRLGVLVWLFSTDAGAGGAAPENVPYRLNDAANLPSIALLLAVTVHFVRSRGLIAQWLKLYCWSTTGIAVLSLAAAAGAVVPTAFSVKTGAVLAGPWSLANGSYLLACAVAAAFWFAFGGGLPLSRRAPFLACGLLLACALAAVLVPTVRHFELQVPSPRPSRPWTLFICEGLLLWLVARTAAKLVVHRREGGGGMHGLLFVILGLTAAAYLAGLFPFCSGIMLGLIAAYPLRDTTESVRVAGRNIVWALCFLPLIAFNVAHVHPKSLSDPRNYAAFASNRIGYGRTDEMARKWEFLAQRHPAERQTHFWLAHVELARDCPYRAAGEFAQSLESVEGKRLILPPPSEAEQGEFLGKLRDYCSALPRPESSFAYEQALLAAGKEAEALNLLGLRSAPRGRRARPDAGETAHGPILNATVELLCAEGVGGKLRAWDTSRLLGLLEGWGAVVERAPQAIPRRLLPLVCVTRHGPHRQEVLVRGALGGAHALLTATGRIPGKPELNAQWSKLEEVETGGWRTTLSRLDDGAGEPRTRVLIHDDGDIGIEFAPPPEGTAAPDAPVVHVWLP